MEDKTKTAPQNACIFDSEPQTIKFADADDEDKGTFSIVAYTGNIIPKHWFWGNLAFDLEGGGVKFDKAKTPVLDSHGTSDRVGFTTKQDVTDKIAVEGKFLSNPAAQELRKDIDDGFPIQASPFMPPEEVEFVEAGESIEVNGHTLKGPGAVFRKARIKDISFCTFGADSKTQGRVFNKDEDNEIKFKLVEKEQDMSENKTKTELTAETFAADHKEIFGEVTARAKAEGEKETRDLFGKFADQFGDDPAFCIEQFKAGVSLDDAVRAENVKLKKTAASTASQAAAEETDLATQEFSDVQEPPADGEATGEPASFMLAVELRMKEGNCTKGEAMKFAVNKYPKLYNEYRAEIEAIAEKNQRD